MCSVRYLLFICLYLTTIVMDPIFRLPVNHHRELLTFYEVNLVWSTGNVALDRYLMPIINNNSLIQIGGPEKGQCGMRAEASSVHSCHRALALSSVFTATDATVGTGVALSLPRAGRQCGRHLSD